ncbi:uncharacterized protein A1O5_09857 [Cladophialophora psammophila CBS 110553]|uniref:ATP-dependent DNA helicase CHL1 n=1 Tax=Cladophialophora psammophila CBS 110553 TaxID=1182543 RepID=W9WQD2_9EURO|nr:uncharacterized protein A1O5_09857 [Cladophialophora psammophila CBS 110553]EXJ67210.1 hypothetical protein A1O5_09857 [Cladophialophora psammophila CBS 110553]
MEPTRANFCHPYQPYSIQLDFMKELYRCIEEKKVGIFESPTGTGKSSSLICGALTWLREHERLALQGQTDGSEPLDWLLEAEKSAQRRELLLEREEFELKLAKIREEETSRRQRRYDLKASKKPRTKTAKIEDKATDEEEFMLEDYESDREESKAFNSSTTSFSSSTQALLDKLQGPAKTEVEEQEKDRLKIIFCSRTHSQLTQFVNELRRVKPPSSILLEAGGIVQKSSLEEGVKHLALGSRKNLCINPKIAGLSSTNAINEQCLELQKAAIPKDKRCPYIPARDDKSKIEAFRDRVVAEIRDIEDTAHLGREMEICPYYASRAAISMSEVLTLPYPLLLQKSAREALGVSVKENVVIIDEAHNLMDAIADTFSISLRLSQLDQAVRQVTAYASRFKNRLKGKNRVYVMQVIRLLNSMTDCLRGTMQKLTSSQATITAAQLMSGKGVDQIKPHKLLQYLHESKLCHKVEGYCEARQDHTDSNQGKGVLMQFQNFLVVLMNPDDEGRFFTSRQDDDVVVHYTLLDPREHFRQIVQDARAVILAGGTMSPMSDYSDYLFSYLARDRLRTFSFGHIIPPSHLFAQVVEKGPSGVEFDFRYEMRASETMILELGNLVVRACSIVPDGVVVFFPSYDYLARVTSVWQHLPASQPIMTALGRVKTIFQESKSVAVDELLGEYATAVDSGKGGLMLSVVGGKLSEGINFSDRLGRAVLAVGLPFPNANGAEWKAKMEHIEGLRFEHCKSQGKGEAECRAEAKSASREYYENACMRAVNQSIGRAIRHRSDYAAILMVDRRFSTERISRKLPGWIQGSMNDSLRDWTKIEKGVGAFFQGKQ